MLAIIVTFESGVTALPTAAVNGTTLHYEVLGSGMTCLVMHGWPGTDHTYLRPGLDVLADRLRLVYYDHRGHGRSGRPPPESITVEQLVDDAEALAAHLGARQVLVLGHFHGASIAQELALRHPHRVAGLILVSATPGELGMTESLADSLDVPPPPPETEVLQRVPPGTDDEHEATMGALALFFSRSEERVDAAALFALTTFNAEAARSLHVLNWWSVVDRLGELAVPALVIAGRHDVFCPPAQAERIARQTSKATLVVLGDSGHLPWLDEPPAFARSVAAWLDRAAGDPSFASGAR